MVMDQIPRTETTPSEPVSRLSERRAVDVVTNSLTVAVDADAKTTRRALLDVDLAGPALRALDALGLGEHVTRRAGGLRWRRAEVAGAIEVDVDIRVTPNADDSAWLSITTRFSATDERARIRLLDAWALVGPLASSMAERAARTVKALAERESFQDAVVVEIEARAA
jgi:hypothetical protein